MSGLSEPSELTEAINAAGADTVAATILADPVWAIFNLTWRRPAEIALVCDRLGLRTLDDVVQWVQRVNAAVGDAQAFVQLVNPTPAVALADCKQIAWPDIHLALANTGLLATDAMLHQSDATYHAPSVDVWRQVAVACPASRHGYKAEVMDCDDYVNVARGWLAGHGLGNLAAFFCATRHFRDQSILRGHAVVLIVDDGGTPHQWEPQTGQIYPITYPKLGGAWLANRLEIAHVSG